MDKEDKDWWAELEGYQKSGETGAPEGGFPAKRHGDVEEETSVEAIVDGLVETVKSQFSESRYIPATAFVYMPCNEREKHGALWHINVFCYPGYEWTERHNVRKLFEEAAMANGGLLVWTSMADLIPDPGDPESCTLRIGRPAHKPMVVLSATTPNGWKRTVVWEIVGSGAATDLVECRDLAPESIFFFDGLPWQR